MDPDPVNFGYVSSRDIFVAIDKKYVINTRYVPVLQKVPVPMQLKFTMQ
jgi:hypothetical protein